MLFAPDQSDRQRVDRRRNGAAGRFGARTRHSADYRQRLRNAVPQHYLQRRDAELARKHHPLLQPFQSRPAGRAHRHHRRRARSRQSRQQPECDCEPVAHPLRRGHRNAAVAGRSSETAFRRRDPAVLPQSGANRRLSAQARAGRVSAENPQARRCDFPVALV